jgi:hypothetical protein
MITVSFDIGIVNLAVCVLKDNQVILWKIISLFEKCKKYIPVENIAESVYIHMDGLIGEISEIIEIKPTDMKIDYVLLENQPSHMNGSMKTVQMLLYGYFQNLKYYDGMVKNVYQVNASLKLKSHIIEKTEMAKTKQERYKNNKADGIRICCHYIKDSKMLCAYLSNHKKKDDLCDCILQAISWLRLNKKTDIHNIIEYKK